MKTGMAALGTLVVGLALFCGACARGLSRPTAPLVTDPAPTALSRTFGDLTILALHTGWVSVKEAHRTLSGPDALRLFRIVADNRWTEWMPIYVYAIVHPEGVWLVDAGLSEAMLEPERFACDPGSRFVYSNLLRFRFEPRQRVDRQLAAVGLEPTKVRGVVFTHRHADHTDAFEFLPESVTAYVGREDWPTHDGALACRWPSGRTPTLVDETGAPFGAFPHSRALTSDARVRIVPLRGHSPGHLAVLVDLGGRFALFAGDSTFSVEQVETRTIAGISEVPYLARRSLELTRAQLELAPTFLLPAHDAASVGRWTRDEVTRLRGVSEPPQGPRS